MSFRLPQNFSASSASETHFSAFEREVAAEKAASLGRAGRKLARCLEELQADPGSPRRDHLLQAAADAAHAYFIQRELCGLTDHRAIVEDYAMPREVIVRVGVRQRDAT
jgi:hypothetical protein